MRKALFLVAIVTFFAFFSFGFSKTAVAVAANDYVVTNKCLELSASSLQTDLGIIKTAMAKNEKALEFLMDKERFISLVKKTGKEWGEECEKEYGAYLEKVLNNKVDLAAQARVLQSAMDEICNELLKRQIIEV